MKKLMVATIAVVVAMIAAPTTISATPIVSIVPVFQSGNIGDTFTVGVNVSGLAGQEIGSFDLDIAYSNLILAGQSVVIAGGLGDPTRAAETMVLSAGFSGGIIDLAEVSLLPASALLALQGGNAFTLATLTFQGLGNGLSPLNITQAIFADGSGSALLLGTANGAIQIGATPIPEPGTLLLVGSVIALAALRRFGTVINRRF